MFLEQIPDNDSKRGWVEVICGSMFSGKTEELIRRLKRVQFARLKVEIFKPSVDTRYAEEEVVSHDSNAIPSKVVANAKDILKERGTAKVIAIDEAQFFDDEVVEVANKLAAQGIRVIVAGLDMDFQGQPFGPMPALMANAEYVTKVHAICMNCGQLANHSHRISKEEGLVVLGEQNNYEPLCRHCFNKVNKA